MSQRSCDPGCVPEVGRLILQLLSASGDRRRRISECYLSSLPNMQPGRLVMQLNVCSGAFPELRAEVGNWSDVSAQGQGALYKITATPGAPPAYFAVIGCEVVRLQRRTK